MPFASLVMPAPQGIEPAIRRSMTIAALLGATMLASALTVARAETVDSAATRDGPVERAAGSAGAATTETREQMVEQRIATLHDQLKITPDEEKKWDAVAKAMRDNAANLDKVVADSHATSSQGMTAVEDLKMYQNTRRPMSMG